MRLKIKAHGPYSRKRPDGTMFSPLPDQEFEITNAKGDPDTAEFYRDLVKAGLATLLVDEEADAAKADAAKAKAEVEAAAAKPAKSSKTTKSTGEAGEQA